MKVRTITTKQIHEIKDLWQELNAHHVLKSTVFKDHFLNFTFKKRMEGLKKRERLIGFVAEEKGKKIGYCIATVHNSIGEIDSLYVRSRYRGKGVGEQLMSLALEWIKQQACGTTTLSVAEGNEEVLGFYRRFGFSERLIVMQKNPC